MRSSVFRFRSLHLRRCTWTGASEREHGIDTPTRAYKPKYVRSVGIQHRSIRLHDAFRNMHDVCFRP